uniref:Uncharacterized protein n=1 Tax=Anopheles farauti TaxID=69004 RepID=A0A182R123_9DIPT
MADLDPGQQFRFEIFPCVAECRVRVRPIDQPAEQIQYRLLAMATGVRLLCDTGDWGGGVGGRRDGELHLRRRFTGGRRIARCGIAPAGVGRLLAHLNQLPVREPIGALLRGGMQIDPVATDRVVDGIAFGFGPPFFGGGAPAAVPPGNDASDAAVTVPGVLAPTVTIAGRVWDVPAPAAPSSPPVNMLMMSGVQTTSLFPNRFFFAGGTLCGDWRFISLAGFGAIFVCFFSAFVSAFLEDVPDADAAAGDDTDFVAELSNSSPLKSSSPSMECFSGGMLTTGCASGVSGVVPTVYGRLVPVFFAPAAGAVDAGDGAACGVAPPAAVFPFQR